MPVAPGPRSGRAGAAGGAGAVGAVGAPEGGPRCRAGYRRRRGGGAAGRAQPAGWVRRAPGVARARARAVGRTCCWWLVARACGQPGGSALSRRRTRTLALEFWHNKAQPEGQDVTTIVTTYNATFAPTKVAEIFQGNGATLLTKLKAAARDAGRHLRVRLLDAQLRGAGRAGPGGGPDQAPGGIKKEDFFPTLISAQTWKGKLQALPYGTGSKGYYVRPEIVKRENVARLPLTEEFDGFASRVTREEQYALGMSATDASWFQLLLGQRGARCSRRPTGRRLPPAAGDRRPGPAHRPGPEEAHAEDHHKRRRLRQRAAGLDHEREWQVRFYRADGTPHDTGFFPRQKASDPPSTLLGVDGFYMLQTTPERRTPPGASSPGCSSRTSTTAGRWRGRSACR